MLASVLLSYHPDMHSDLQKVKIMRAEIQNVVDEIKQGLALLRRHL
jgi:hypothetical protein